MKHRLTQLPLSLFALATTVFVFSLQSLTAVSRITLDSTINGIPIQLVVDTKSDGTTLFAHAANRLGLKWTAPDPNASLAPGRVAAGRSELCKLDIGSGPADFIFNVVDAPQYQRLQIDGIISWRALKNNILMFDGELKQFSALAAIPEFAENWMQLDIVPDSSSLTILSKDLRISIHSGSDAGVRLPPEAWADFSRENTQTPRTLEAYSTPSNPVNVSEVFGLQKFSIGGIDLENVFLGKMTSLGNESFDAELGIQALNGLILIVDGINSTCYISKSQNQRPLPDYNRLGAVFAPKDIRTSNALIATVAKGSPAEKEGIKDNDELIRIGDLDVTQWRTKPGILPLGRFWQDKAGTEYKLKLIRDGETIDIPVTLDNILE